MQAGDLLHDGEPEPRAFAPRVGSLEGIELFENPIAGEIGKPRPVVQDFDARPGAPPFLYAGGPDLDGPVPRRKGNGVFDQVEQSLLQQEPLSRDRQSGSDIADPTQAFTRQTGLQSGLRFGGEGGDPHGFDLEEAPAALQPGKV